MTLFLNEKMPGEKVFSVSKINEALKKITSTFFSNIWLEGEISSIRFHNTGNVYLTLKDEQAVIDAVIFKNSFKTEFQNLKEGDKVLALGGISVYVKGGKYSFNIWEIRSQGKGPLFEQFLRLKEKLEKEGLFDEAFKKPIPFLPRRIGIVTSSDGAAVRDILKVTRRRFPGADVLIFPVKVQGEGSSQTIAQAVRAANKVGRLDVLIVGRGGGSYDELAVFNDEEVARVVFESKIPVISAVGHERDFTIIDFVADSRAATPSQAAEMAVPDRQELIDRITQAYERMTGILENRIRYYLAVLENSSGQSLHRILMDRLENAYRELDDLQESMDSELKARMAEAQNQLVLYFYSLEKLNPLYLLKKNYAVVYHEAGGVVKSSAELEKGDLLSILLKDGRVKARVEEKISLKESEIGRC